MACLQTSTRTLEAGTSLFQNGQSAEYAVLVRKGNVRLFLDGQMDIGMFGAGSVLGLSEVLVCGHYQTHAIAVEKTVAEYIPQRALFTLLLHDSTFGFQILEGASNDLIQLMGKIHSLPRCRKHQKSIRPVKQAGHAA